MPAPISPAHGKLLHPCHSEGSFTGWFLRCNTSVCQICARTCTSAPSSSIPPTPLLSYSPSPPPSASLSLADDTTVEDIDVRNPTKRLEPSRTRVGRVRTREDDDDGTDGGSMNGEEENIRSKGGCGLKVCRKCCIEDGHVSFASELVITHC